MRTDAEALAAQLVLHGARAEQGNILRPQHHAGFLLVYVEYDGGDFGMLLQQLRHEGLSAGEFRRRRHQHHHDLPRCMAGADQHVPQKAPVSVFIINAQLVAGEHPHDGLDDAVSPLILNEAVLHRDNVVGPHGIYAGDGLFLPVRGDDGMHLVAVMVRILHAEDGLHRAELAQQLLDLALLVLQLLGVGQVAKLASAAAGGDGTMRRWFRLAGCIVHGERLLFCKVIK